MSDSDTMNPKTNDANGSPTLSQVTVWDVPVRLFHWLLAGLIGVGWYLGYFRTFANIDWHFYVGYAVGGLVVLRLIWGFVGSATARLSALFWSPKAVAAYASTLPKREPSGFIGHSPLGSLSVLALIASVVVQVVTGLCAEDDALFSAGPLSEYVPASTVTTLTAIHYYNSRILIGLIGLHLLAITFYLIWKRENLVTPMVTGRKSVARKQDHA